MSKNTLLTVLILPLVIVYGDLIAWAARSLVEKIFNVRVKRIKWLRWLGMRGIDRVVILLMTIAALVYHIGNPVYWILLAAAMLVSLVNWKSSGLTIKMRGLRNEKNESRLN